VLAPVALLALSACGTSVSTSNFKGEEHAVAQAVANLQSHATANEQGKICSNDLSAAVVARLGGKSGCEEAIKTQVSEIENLELTVESVKIAPGGKTATVQVKSTYKNKPRLGTLSLVKEGGSWRIAGL
jgi:hypothetical protein